MKAETYQDVYVAYKDTIDPKQTNIFYKVKDESFQRVIIIPMANLVTQNSDNFVRF